MAENSEWLRRSWNESKPAECLVIAFGGLAGRLGGAGGRRATDRHLETEHNGMPPHEFVRTCERAGATHAIFCRDLQQAWYLRGVPNKPQGGFDAVVDELRAEIAHLRPRRVVTVGASMGGYAAIRSAVALGANACVAFAPQCLVDSTERAAAELPPMPFDDGLKALKRVLWVEGKAMPSLAEIVRKAAPAASPRGSGDGERQAPSLLELEVHVGANERGDVQEVAMLLEAVEEVTAQAATATAATATAATATAATAEYGRPWIRMHVVEHAGKDHNVVTSLRDDGQLDAVLRKWIGEPIAPSATAAAATGNGGGGGHSGGGDALPAGTRQCAAGK